MRREGYSSCLVCVCVCVCVCGVCVCVCVCVLCVCVEDRKELELRGGLSASPVRPAPQIYMHLHPSRDH